jgi:hypothetical protein
MKTKTDRVARGSNLDFLVHFIGTSQPIGSTACRRALCKHNGKEFGAGHYVCYFDHGGGAGGHRPNSVARTGLWERFEENGKRYWKLTETGWKRFELLNKSDSWAHIVPPTVAVQTEPKKEYTETMNTETNAQAMNQNLVANHSADLLAAAKVIVKNGSAEDSKELVEFLTAYIDRLIDFNALVKSINKSRGEIARTQAIIHEEF